MSTPRTVPAGSAAGVAVGALGAVLLAASLSVSSAAAIAAEGFVATLQADYGRDAALRGARLTRLLDELRHAPRNEQLRGVNRFFNAFGYRSDRKLWRREDHWATPVEFIGRFAGDCEDFALAKYFALRWLGFERDSMQLAYVYDLKRSLFHIVLQVDAAGGGAPMILDNAETRILPADRRRELVKIVGFGEGLVAVVLPGGTGERSFGRGGSRSMREWDRVLARSGAEPRPALGATTRIASIRPPLPRSVAWSTR